jgi:uncharacterized membrane protein YoaK (UPF0700 family)
LIILVLLAGATDALMFTHSKDLLAVYMTGDTSKLGQSVAEGKWPALGPLAAVIGAFLGATTFGAWLGPRVGRWRAAGLLTLVALCFALAWPDAQGKYPLSTVLLVATAMGLLNQVLADEPGITFITGTLVRLGRAIADLNAPAVGKDASRWLAWLVGAALGTLLDVRLEAFSALVFAVVFFAGAVVAARQAWSHGAAVSEQS